MAKKELILLVAIAMSTGPKRPIKMIMRIKPGIFLRGTTPNITRKPNITKDSRIIDSNKGLIWFGCFQENGVKVAIA
jgi:hypothetical protein